MDRGADSWPIDEALDAAAGEPTLSVTEVGERLAAALSAAFPRSFWLVGEASGWARSVASAGNRGGHWYFQLADPDGKDARTRAAVEVKCWRFTIEKLFGRRGRLQGLLQPEDGLVIRVRVKADYYAPRGQVSFTIEDIDPDFTLGALDRERRELLKALEADGSLVANKARPLPEVPLRLGLVTSEGSAAHHDVLHTLRSSGLGFRIALCDARTQGADTGRSVAAALAALARLPLDAILLVRGGGSRLDLSWFDKEDVARAIAACPLPVLTGIGHEIDRSVADEVAHTAHKTPTAAAEWLVAQAREARDGTELRAQRVAELALATLGSQESALAQGARSLLSGTRAGLAGAREALAGIAHDLAARCSGLLAAWDSRLVAAQVLVLSGRHDERLARCAADLGRDADRLRLGALRTLDEQAGAIEGVAERVRLLDPAVVLSRGFAWLRRADGRVLMDAGAVRPGEPLVAVLRDGELPLRHDGARPPGGGS